MKFNPIVLLLSFLLISCSSAPTIDVREYPVRISNLGAIVNSTADDISPTITANGTQLYFTSDRSVKPAIKREGFFAKLIGFFSDLFTTKKCCGQDFWFSTFDGKFWSTPENVGAPINTITNEGSPSISADGQTLYFAACDRDDAVGRCDIYVAHLKGKGWISVVNLGPPVNSKSWESQPSISSDGSTLYFVSDRSGGHGGLDLWMSQKGNDGKWQAPVNLDSTINTSGDETSPFIASDGKTLYFSSDGHPGLGGSDMFVTRFVNGKWLKPVNLGKPLNSPDNDEFYTLTAEGNVVYFASRRAGGLGGYDTYRAEPNPFPPGAVVVLSGVVRDKKTKVPLAASMSLKDAKNNNQIGVYKSNEYTGEYLIVLPAGIHYELIVEASSYLKERAEFDLTTQEIYNEIHQDFLLRKDEPAPKLSASVTADVLTSDFSILKSSSIKTPGLTVEEIVYKEVVPLLNYIFFEKGKSTIPSRYRIINTAETENFNPSVVDEETISRYRNILNILGWRLQKNQNINVTLVGNNDDTDIEKGNTTLSSQRAEEIKKYFVDVWKIQPERIQIEARNLPINKSTSGTEEGREENRRVEIFSDDSRLLLPIEITDVQKVIKPQSVLFNLSIEAQAELNNWKFAVTQNGKELRTSDGYSQYPDSIRWDWKDVNGNLPRVESPLAFTLEAKDNSGNETRTTPQEIPVRFVTLKKKNAENLPDKSVEKVSLILFDFDKSDIGEKNKLILSNAAINISPRSTILLRGFTDASGEENYNLRLSEKRAEMAAKVLSEKIPNLNMRYEGVGESTLLFPNDTPEGRFYCRTVQIVIETPREE